MDGVARQWHDSRDKVILIRDRRIKTPKKLILTRSFISYL